MKKKQETRTNSNGAITTIETIETTPEDGFVREREIKPVRIDTYGKYHKGYAKTKSFSTNDPRITRPFIYGMCGIFFVIGVFTLLIGWWYFAIPFIGISVFTFVKAKKDIDEIAEELKRKGYDVTIDSVEEKEQLNQEVVGTFKDSLKDVTSSAFTEDKYNWFLKTTIPIYCVIVAIVVVLISVFINIFLGLFLLIILALGGLLYYYLISKLFKR